MRLARLFLLSACGLFLLNATVAVARHLTANQSSLQKPNAVIVVTPQQAPAQKPPTLADFAWLAGHWEGPLPFPGSDKPLTA